MKAKKLLKVIEEAATWGQGGYPDTSLLKLRNRLADVIAEKKRRKKLRKGI